MSILRSTPNHIPLKYKCPHYCYVGFRHVSHKIKGAKIVTLRAKYVIYYYIERKQHVSC